MDGQIARGVWKVVDRPKGKTVLGTKTVFKREVDQDGRVKKYKCRFVAKGFRQIKRIHYQESSSPTPTQASILMALAVMALLDWEGRQLDVEMTFLEMGKVVVILVVYVDDLLMLSETKQDEHQALEDLRSIFPIKDLGEISY
ncbi:unnamed protein product [Ascophyllum nodosum]